MEGKTKNFYFVILIFLVCSQAVAQTFPYSHYTVRHGLSSSNVYCISQDKEGYMWFGTENGVSRFDGFEFVNYSNPQFGLTSFISSIWPFNKDSILVGTNLEGVKQLNLQDGKVTSFISGSNLNCNQILYTDTVITALSEYHAMGFYYRQSGHKNKIDELLSRDGLNLPVCMIQDSKGRVIIGRTSGLYQVLNDEQIPMKIIGLDQRPVYSLVEKKNGNYLLGMENEIIETDGIKVLSRIPISIVDDQKISNIKEDSRQNIWFSFRDNSDIYMYREGRVFNISKAIGTYKGLVTEIYPDRDGNIWVSLIGKGVYLFSNASIFNYLEQKLLTYSNILCVRQNVDELAMGTHDGLIIKSSSSSDVNTIKSFGAMEEYIRDINFPSKNEIYATLTDRRIFSSPKGFYPYIKKNGINYYHGSSLYVDSTRILLGNWDDKIYIFSRKQPGILLDSIGDITKTRNSSRINSIYEDGDGALWVGTQKGLFHITQNGEVTDPDRELLQTNIKQVDQLNENEMIVCSAKGFGVYTFRDGKTEPVREYNIPFLNCVYYKDQKHIYLGTQNGLVCLLNNDTIVIGLNDGLPSSHINCLHFDRKRNLLIVGTPEGFSEINIDKYFEKRRSEKEVYITSINNSGSVYDENGRQSFDYSANSIHIKFAVFNYENPSALKFQYRHNDDPWVDTKSHELEFASLSPGEHDIRIRAGVKAGMWGPEKLLKFYITPPFYRTTWFYFISGLLFIGAVILFINERLKILRQKQEEQHETRKRMIELQQQALSSNLNPHFIFNALNSIQYFINYRNPDEANKYLSGFSRLMRMHLNFSDRTYILLEEELFRLRDYLELEQMRFEGKMRFEIIVDPQVDPASYEIPNMVIQPFVENSIWHGIMSSDESGEVVISIRMNEDQIMEISVADNGVGMVASGKKVRKGHESKGVSIIRQRLELMDPEARDIITFDSNSGHGNLPGTLVVIRLTPPMYRFRPVKLYAES